MNSIIDSICSVISDISIAKLLGTIALLAFLIIASRCIVRLIRKILTKSRLSGSFADFITTIAKYALYFLSILIVCDSLGLPITSLLAVFSLFGLAISLSVQSLLSNLMSGLTVHTLKPFEVGDFIETDICGTVESIGLFYTVLLTLDNKKVFIPNEKVLANKLINYNGNTTRRIDLVFNAGYMYEPRLVMQALREAVDSVELINKDPECIIAISDYGESAINYSVWAWVESTAYIPAKHAIMEAVWESYKKHGITMAYNRLEVEMINKDN